MYMEGRSRRRRRFGWTKRHEGDATESQNPTNYICRVSPASVEALPFASPDSLAKENDPARVHENPVRLRLRMLCILNVNRGEEGAIA